jgi:hypothetical protein
MALIATHARCESQSSGGFGTIGSGWLSDRFDNRWLLFWYYGLRGTPSCEELRRAIRRWPWARAEIDKRLQAKAGYGFYDKYELLCEIAHPNRPGFEMFISDKNDVDGFWDAYKINEKTWSNVHAFYLKTVLWTLSFCCGSMVAIQGVYQETNRLVKERMKFAYPLRS